MKYTLENGKTVNIPDKEIEKSMKALELSKAEAIQLWLEDNDYEVNEEQVALDEKAKKVKINRGASAIDKTKKEKKERKVVASDEKQALFGEIYLHLKEIFGDNVEIVKENKLLTVTQGTKVFKVDIVEQRPPKNK